jgi:hypothetical protein
MSERTFMILRVSAVLLVLWGLLNTFAGVTEARGHPSMLVAPLFVLCGLLITGGGVGFWLATRWAMGPTVLGLLGISGTALFSGTVLHGWSGLQLSHHLLRLVI